MSSLEELEQRVAALESELAIVRQEAAAAQALAAGADRDVTDYRDRAGRLVPRRRGTDRHAHRRRDRRHHRRAALADRPPTLTVTVPGQRRLIPLTGTLLEIAPACVTALLAAYRH